MQGLVPTAWIRLLDTWKTSASFSRTGRPNSTFPAVTASGDPKLLARTFGFFATDEGLKEIKTYADGIGPWKRYIIKRGERVS